jgi:hypothetical protein
MIEQVISRGLMKLTNILLDMEGVKFMYCKNCGNLVQEGDAFCRKCGNPITVEKASKICPKCGNDVQDGDAFCNVCGCKIENIEFNQVAPQNKNKKKMVIIVASCILVLAIAILVGVLVSLGKRSSGKNVSSSEDIIGVTTQMTADENDIGDVGEKMVRQIFYDGDGSIIGEIKYEYECDSKGNVIKKIYLNIEVTMNFFDEFECEYKCEYDSHGNVISRIEYNSDGSISNIIYENEYDEQGNMISCIGYNSDGSISYKRGYGYEYDEQGNMIKQIWYGSDDSIINEYEYDEQGNMIKQIWYDRIYDCIIYEYEYDSHGNLNMIKRIDYNYFNDDGTVYEYDGQRNIIKVIVYDNDGTVSDFRRVEYLYE